MPFRIASLQNSALRKTAAGNHERALAAMNKAVALYRRGSTQRSRPMPELLLLHARLLIVNRQFADVAEALCGVKSAIEASDRFTSDEKMYLKCYAGSQIARAAQKLPGIELGHDLIDLRELWSKGAAVMHQMTVSPRIRLSLPMEAEPSPADLTGTPDPSRRVA